MPDDRADAADTGVPIPLRERPWFIAVMMFAFFPAGLVMFWRHEAWDYRVKWLVTVVVLGSVLWAAAMIDL